MLYTMQIFLDKNITFRRLRIKSGDRSVYSATGTAAPASIQGLTPEQAILAGGAAGRSFRCYIQEADMPLSSILEGDQIKHGSDLYSVRGVKKLDWGSFHHYAIDCYLEA